jgi:hypothetical protein
MQTSRAWPARIDLDERPRSLVSVATGDTAPGTENDVICVLIAYGDSVARTRLRAVLSTRRDMAVVGCAADEDQVLALAGQVEPDVMLVDSALPGIDGSSSLGGSLSTEGPAS